MTFSLSFSSGRSRLFPGQFRQQQRQCQPLLANDVQHGSFKEAFEGQFANVHNR